MKKSILLISFMVCGSVYAANTYNVVVTPKKSNYITAKETGNIICSSVAPLANTIYKGTSFSQNHSNCKKEIQQSNGTLSYVSTDDYTSNEVGTLLLGSCKEILNNGHSVGDKNYQAMVAGTEKTLTCDMTTNGGGWTLTYSNYFVGQQDGPFRTDMLPHIQTYADVNANAVMFDLENRWFVMNDITHAEFDWMFDSGKGHQYQNVASSVNTSIGVTYSGSEVVWQKWNTQIYELNKNSGTWDANTIFDLGYDSNHGAAFWDNANGTYKRLGGYQTPANLTLKIWVR